MRLKLFHCFRRRLFPRLIELGTDNDHLEVSLTSLGHVVHVRFVDHLSNMVVHSSLFSREMTSKCSGLNLSVSLALMEAATLPSSPAIVNLHSRREMCCGSSLGADTILCSLGCCPRVTKTTNPAQQAAGGHPAKVCNLSVSFALVLGDRRTS